MQLTLRVMRVCPAILEMILPEAPKGNPNPLSLVWNQVAQALAQRPGQIHGYPPSSDQMINMKKLAKMAKGKGEPKAPMEGTSTDPEVALALQRSSSKGSCCRANKKEVDKLDLDRVITRRWCLDSLLLATAERREKRR
ncbi:hypothetical protein Acr_00g0068220 [Actinidia rufa]|uniref:Uncharacterized protein n=1 Tax=Actinidia rufa TaxID=165716 RepID=A0A7J0DS28_9ERIC|nr:hypothetical protein Acr_00g0068220 [Actinidia rufa]